MTYFYIKITYVLVILLCSHSFCFSSSGADYNDYSSRPFIRTFETRQAYFDAYPQMKERKSSRNCCVPPSLGSSTTKSLSFFSWWASLWNSTSKSSPSRKKRVC